MPAPLPSILNFRDVGETVNSFTGVTLIAPGKLYRSARPDEARSADRHRLVQNYGIRNIIDLRTKTEHFEQAQKRDAQIRSSEVALVCNDEVAQPLKIHGVTYHEINFNGRAFSRNLISQLSWWNFGKLVMLMAVGRRLEAISILGTNVMQPQGLIGLATSSIDVCGQEILSVFELLMVSSNYPLMIHCTQGKDRTGLVVQLCLLLLEVPIEAIDHDYMLTQTYLAPERDSRVREISSIGLGEEFADCDPRLVAAVAEHIKEKYSSTESYLLSIGVTKAMQDKVKDNLSPPASVG